MNTTTTETVERRRRKTALFLGLAAVLVVLLIWVAVSFFNGRSQAAQSTADGEAAGYADMNLLELLNETMPSGGGLPELEDALRDEEEAGTSSGSPFSVISGETSGSNVPAVVYYRAEDKSFSGGFSGSPDFGIACRLYAVDDSGVTVQQVDCPSNTPEHPFHDYRPALDTEGGLRFPDEMDICEYDSGELKC